MAKVPSIEAWAANEEVKASKLTAQVNAHNNFFLKDEHMLIQQIDKAYTLTPDNGGIYLSIIGAPDQLGGWASPTGGAHSDYTAPDSGVYFFHAQFSPSTPDFTTGSDLEHTIQLRVQYRKSGVTTWDQTFIANAYETNQWMNKSWNVPFTVQTSFSLYMNKGDAVRFPVYLGQPNGGNWGGGYKPEWKNGAPSSNRVQVWRMSAGATSFAAPAPVNLPAQEAWTDGEIVSSAKLNAQTTEVHKHMSSLPRFYVSGHQRPSANAVGGQVVPWRTSKVEQSGNWSFNGTEATVPQDGIYLIAADICVENQSGKVLQYLTAYLRVNAVNQYGMDKAAHRTDQVNVTFNLYSIRFLKKGQKVSFTTGSQAEYNYGASSTVNGFTYNKGSWSMHMLAGGMTSFGKAM
jgi:hypothetical protein